MSPRSYTNGIDNYTNNCCEMSKIMDALIPGEISNIETIITITG